jgi:NAD kinase
MSTLTPRAVFVTRETDFEMLLARHATREQARFFLETRGQQLSQVEAQHERMQAVLRTARASVPAEWRHAFVKRQDLDRFLFSADDLIVIVGQDGLVANVAKYLTGQPVIGVNPLPDVYDGVLVRLPVGQLETILTATVAGEIGVEQRTMATAVLDQGETILALNEIFVGHRSHQSARYTLSVGDRSEYQSSSGVIAATGTGRTGWARSIIESIHVPIELEPTEPALAFLVREPFPSIATGTEIRAGKLTADPLHVISKMNEGGVIFADGVEQDFLEFNWGRQVSISKADRTLRLVAP